MPKKISSNTARFIAVSFSILISFFIFSFSSPPTLEAFTISDNETWDASLNGGTFNTYGNKHTYSAGVHTITENVVVKPNGGAVPCLRIDSSHGPVLIKFAANCGIEIGEDFEGMMAKFITTGPAENKITFTATNTSQPWKGLYFKRPQASRTKLEHCIFSYGGAGSHDDPETYAIISLNMSVPSPFDDTNPIRDCLITHSDSAGVNAVKFGTNTQYPYGIVMDNCTIENSDSYGLYIKMQNTPKKKALLKNCIIRNNGAAVTAGGVFARETKQCIFDNCTVENNSGDGFSIDSTYKGTDNDSQIKNSTIRNNTGKAIVISSQGGLYCNLMIKNNYIANHIQGIYAQTERDLLTVQDNIFIQNGNIPIRVPASALLADSNYFDNNTKAIEILATSINSNTTSQNTVIWHNFNVPYSVIQYNAPIFDWITVDSAKTLLIDNGTKVLFSEETGLYARGSGKIHAVGTKDRPITLTAKAHGKYWKGVVLDGSSYSVSGTDSRLQYCVIEYAGNRDYFPPESFSHFANVCFYGSYPSSDTIKNCTIRYSKTDGIWVHNSTENAISHNNIYGNGNFDVIFCEWGSPGQYNARLNYWGTEFGPTGNVCSGAVVENTDYDPWLREEFTNPFKFTAAGASPKQFNPITQYTTISFTLSQAAHYTLSIVNQQLERVWSTSGDAEAAQNVNVDWNGVGDFGAVSGLCYYTVEAESAGGRAAPAMGMLMLGDQTVAQITSPTPGSLFAKGAAIDIYGIANGSSYQLFYGAGVKPGSWTSMYSSSSGNPGGLLYTWNTSASLPEPFYTIRLDVEKSGVTYTDVVGVSFYQPPSKDNATEIIYSYDSLGRLTRVRYPNDEKTNYTYDKVGNRLSEERDTPTLIELASFTARPTLKGVVVEWRTESEIGTAGFNLYRKMQREGEYRKITASLIPAKGSPTSGATYRFTDVPEQRVGVCRYLLEEIETGGGSKRYGPVSSLNMTIIDSAEKRFLRKSINPACDE